LDLEDHKEKEEKQAILVKLEIKGLWVQLALQEQEGKQDDLVLQENKDLLDLEEKKEPLEHLVLVVKEVQLGLQDHQVLQDLEERLVQLDQPVNAGIEEIQVSLVLQDLQDQLVELVKEALLVLLE